MVWKVIPKDKDGGLTKDDGARFEILKLIHLKLNDFRG